MFFTLTIDFETKGNYAKLEGPVYDLVDNAEDLSRFEITNYKPNFNLIEFSRYSKEVDAIYDFGSTSGAGFIVSKKFKNILEEFRLPNHRFYELEFLKKGATQSIKGQYFWFQFLLIENYEWIDFEKSKFEEHEEIGEYIGDLNIRNATELQFNIENSFENGNRILYKSLVFNGRYNNEDFFTLFRIGGFASIISERLKIRLENEGITGLEAFKQLAISRKV